MDNAGNKNYVSMEQHQCVVCGAVYDTGALLLDKRLKNSMEQHTVTGLGMCPEHQKLKDEGYIALVEVADGSDKKHPVRLGRIAHIRSSAWLKIFNTDAPPEMVGYVEKTVMNMLESESKG